MRWSVIVPFRGDGAERSRNWEWCKARLEWQIALLDDAELIVADSGHSPFNRAASRNEGAARASGDLLMLIDADGANDNWIEAGEEVARHAGWTICYQEPDGYVALTEEATERLLSSWPGATLEIEPEDCQQRVHSYAGCIVVRAKEFATVRGYDSRFQGWGYEDDAFREVMETVVGPARRMPGDHVHLWHPHVESERFRQPHIGENRNLANSYGAARGNREAMLRLVERR